ncbi:MAG: hypothetical protein LUG12_02750 [Erysipelotrichaceae bacterium]|nr:hypothetical protein [Erysipelotrichaceae bacterium]
MKELIYQYYQIDVIGIIKISDRVFKIKSYNDFYVAKIVNNYELEKIFYNIDAMQINVLVKVLLNIKRQYLTSYKHQYIYLMPFLENKNDIPVEIKIKKYFELIAYLHNQSFYTIKVNDQYFQQLYEDLSKIIQERFNYYQQLILKYEKISFRSPSQWYFIMNYHHLYEALENSHNYLRQFIDLTNDYTDMRICFNYQNFDLAHVLMKPYCLLAIDHICMQMPIFDLYSVFENEKFSLFNEDILWATYFQLITLKNHEKILLKCLLYMIPCIEFTNDEIDNILLLTKLLTYIEEVDHFIRQI